MIPVRRPTEPDEFDERTRQPGRKWLTETKYEHRARPRNFWSWCDQPLRVAFEERCGWAAMYIADGHIDHFVSWDECRHERPELAYEWSNYRYVLPRLNSGKCKERGLLDPFEVQPGWFRVKLPSLLLECTPLVPADRREAAQRTIERLGLVGDRNQRIRRLRAEWLDKYRSGKLTLEQLRWYAPLVAAAVERVWTAPLDGLDEDETAFRFLLMRETLAGRRLR